MNIFERIGFKKLVKKQDTYFQYVEVIKQLKQQLENENFDKEKIKRLVLELEKVVNKNEIFNEKSEKKWWQRFKNSFEGIKAASNKILKIAIALTALNFLFPASLNSQEKKAKKMKQNYQMFQKLFN